MPNWPAALAEFVSAADYRAVKPVSLAKRMGVPKKELHAFRDALAAAVDSGEVLISEQGRVLPRSGAAGDGVIGTLRKAPGGATVNWPKQSNREGKSDPDRKLFIDRDDFGSALLGDTVRVKVTSGRNRDGLKRGLVISVLERARTQFAGRYYEADDRGWVEIQGRLFEQPVEVGDPGAKGVKTDDIIVVDLIRFPTSKRPGEGVIADILGQRGDAGVETQQVIFEFGLPVEFPEEVMEEARRQAATWNPDEVPADRDDLTSETIITIDPNDARDFDDAISLSQDERGHWMLGVHIADVGHFVEAGSVLDHEARKRGTSVYLPTQVIPMLPEVISNGLASLQEGNIRLTKSVFIEYDPNGVFLGGRLARTAIRNKKRLRYEEVLPICDDADDAIEVEPEVKALLLRMRTLARTLRKRRFRKGALELTMPEIKLRLGDDNEVVGADEVDHDESHQIIEEFMLAANVAVAEELLRQGVLFPRRAHPEPDPVRLTRFKEFVEALGYQLPNEQDRRAIQKLLDRVEGTPEAPAVSFALLRSMQQAIYTVEEIGHYALAFENYCHFTSPIRRYPDLMVHRLVDALVQGHLGGRAPDPGRLEQICEQCSDLSRRAEAAERMLTELKLIGYYADRIGETFPAVVTGVERFGLFCRGTEIPVEGLLLTQSLPDDFYDYSRETYCMVGRRTGKTFRLGDVVQVKVVEIDRDRRQIRFGFVKRLSEKDGSKDTSKGGSRGGGKSNGKSHGKSHGKAGGKKKGKSAKARKDANRRAGRKKNK